jgi:hypothetical protein
MNLDRVMNKTGFYSVFLGGILLFLSSCATTLPELSIEERIVPPATDPDWQHTDIEGIRSLSYQNPSEQVSFHALAVDLEIQGLRFFITPPDPESEGETRSATVSSFARKYNLSAAINGAPYDNKNYLNRENAPEDIVGLYIYEGERVSEGISDYDALYILYDGSVEVGSQNSVPDNVRWAVGGFHIVLSDGNNLGTADARHPRSLIGLSKDRKTLFLAVTDGRQKGCAGMTTRELGEWMFWLGAFNAINMDGGGSSALVLRSGGEPVLMNSPIHGGFHGLERAVASHVGLLLPE